MTGDVATLPWWSGPAWLHGAAWPYVLLIVFAVLPTQLWRFLGVALSRGLPETSPVVEWVRLVATALLAAVVIKLLLSPSGALIAVPMWARFASVTLGAVVFFAAGRSLLFGVLAGEALLITAAWWAGG